MKSIIESRLGDDTAFVDKRDYQQGLILCTQYLFQPQNSRMEKKLVLSVEKEEMLLKEGKQGDPFAETTIIIENL